jgi:endonuclease YncB( thermonuclease family)
VIRAAGGALLLLVLAVPPVAAAERLVGRARAVDGDTLDVGGIRVRLQGVAAPELHEPGGPEAAAFMAELVEDRIVVCELGGRRSRGRRTGLCRREGLDVGAAEIAAGLARACNRYNQGRYAALETAAGRRLPLPAYCEPR